MSTGRRSAPHLPPYLNFLQWEIFCVMECTLKLICVITGYLYSHLFGYTSYMKALLLMPTWKHFLSRDILHFTLAIPTPGSSVQLWTLKVPPTLYRVRFSLWEVSFSDQALWIDARGMTSVKPVSGNKYTLTRPSFTSCIWQWTHLTELTIEGCWTSHLQGIMCKNIKFHGWIFMDFHGTVWIFIH